MKMSTYRLFLLGVLLRRSLCMKREPIFFLLPLPVLSRDLDSPLQSLITILLAAEPCLVMLLGKLNKTLA